MHAPTTLITEQRHMPVLSFVELISREDIFRFTSNEDLKTVDSTLLFYQALKQKEDTQISHCGCLQSHRDTVAAFSHQRFVGITEDILLKHTDPKAKENYLEAANYLCSDRDSVSSTEGGGAQRKRSRSPHLKAAENSDLEASSSSSPLPSPKCTPSDYSPLKVEDIIKVHAIVGKDLIKAGFRTKKVKVGKMTFTPTKDVAEEVDKLVFELNRAF